MNDAGALLASSLNGDAQAEQRLNSLTYHTLRDLAASCMRGERRNHTLSATGLLHEAYIRLVESGTLDAECEQALLCLAARTMRCVLVDHARSRNTDKRGGAWERITISEFDTLAGAPNVDLMELDEAMTELETLHEREARVVELRFFGGFTIEETAEALGVSPRTVAIDWRHARAWLLSRLSDAAQSHSNGRGPA